MAHFGTDGIRGKAEIFTDEYLSGIGAACAVKFGRGTCVMARDTRVSGDSIARRLGKALATYGVRVMYCGILPTPALAYLTRAYGASFGVMVSASHNPPEYNGIKLFDGTGAKITSEEEAEIEGYIDGAVTPPEGAGSFAEAEGGEEYIAHFATFAGRTLKNMRILLDTANGATGALAPEFFRRLGCYVEAVNGETDGKNINMDCGATHPQNLLKIASEGSYDFAFAFDGDGDRVIGVRNGKVIDGDRALFVLARYLCLDKGVEPAVAVGTVTSNGGTEASLARLGIAFERTDVGDKNVYERMCKTGAPIGGESSGHVIIRDMGRTGDGIVTAMTLCLAHADIGYDYLDDMVSYPVAEDGVEADENAKHAVLASKEITDYAKRKKADGIRVVIRPSGTEPKVRISVEAESYEYALKTLAEARDAVLRVICQNSSKEELKNICMDNQNKVIEYMTEADFERAGAIVKDIRTTFIERGVMLGKGVTVYPMVCVSGKSRIGAGSSLYSFCDLSDTVVGENSDLRSTYAVGARIGSGTTVGPFACLRKGAVVGDGCRIGDYVEVKNSVLGNGVKSAHLAYIGDADVGDRTNVGCGTVFANYDGKIKQRTRVGKDVFIGCNTNLIAPLTVGDGAYIAGGSTVTENLECDDFCIARARQTTKKRPRTDK